MIHSAHVILYSKDSAADLAFLRDLLDEPASVDAGGGWLIMALPPVEIAVPPSDENDVHELYFMTDDVNAFREKLEARGVESSDVSEERWGSLTQVKLPGGGKIGVYQPKHASPLKRGAAKKSAAKKGTKKVAGKKNSAKKAPAKKAAGKKSAKKATAKNKSKRR